MFFLVSNSALGKTDTVEMDETYIGGKFGNMHKDKRDKITGRGTSGKIPVWGAVERSGKVVAVTVPNVDGVTLLPHIREHVIPATTVCTDEAGGYYHLKNNGYNHKVIRHNEHVYVSGDVHTNTIEGFWSLTKRGIDGVYHSVSTKYLQGYLNEYAWRYNHRNDGRAQFASLLLRAARS